MLAKRIESVTAEIIDQNHDSIQQVITRLNLVNSTVQSEKSLNETKLT
jgi:hypothetical protein